MVDVFISYSRRDKIFVQRLHEALVVNGRDTWVDWEDIPLTADWWAEIQEGIEGADSFIFVISPDSVDSKVCGQELDHAIAHNKRLIPVVYREAENVPSTITHINWIYFRESDDFEAHLKDLLAVMDTDLDWTKAHTRLTQRAVEWHKKERNYSYVLIGDDLAEAEKLLSETKKLPALTQLQRDFILASQQKQAADLHRDLEQAKALAETEKRRREEAQRYTAQIRRRSLFIIGALAAVILVGLMALFWAAETGRLLGGTDEIVDTLVEFGNAQANSDLCWAGTIQGLANEVMPACEMAIELEPEVSYFHESRALARALTNNYAGAIADFSNAIRHAQETGEGEDRIFLWEDWIAQLQQDANPFSEELLQELREDWEAEKEYYQTDQFDSQ
jgi:hypothetical protein